MSESPEQRWVWRSTAASRSAGIVSVLAIFETIMCVLIYWALLLWMGVNSHHWIVLLAAPLMLLRSDLSVAEGIKQFDKYMDDDSPLLLRSGKGMITTALLLLGAVFIVLFTIYSLKNAEDGWRKVQAGVFAVYLSVAVVSSLVFAVSGSSAIEGFRLRLGDLQKNFFGQLLLSVLVSLTAVGALFGVWIRAIAIRLTSVVRFLLPGLWQLPKNWRDLTIASDLFHPPELIPGHKKFEFGGDFYIIESRSSSHVRVNGFAIVAFLFWHAPTLLWRWSIKSTAWLYLPLLWVRRDWILPEKESLHVWALSYSSKALNWLWMGLGWLYLVTLAVALFNIEKWLEVQSIVTEVGAPMTPLGFLMAIEWAEVLRQPWLWFSTPAYLLTLIIFFKLDEIAKEIRVGGELHGRRSATINSLRWAANARSVLTKIGILLTLWYFLDAIDAADHLRTRLASVLCWAMDSRCA